MKNYILAAMLACPLLLAAAATDDSDIARGGGRGGGGGRVGGGVGRPGVGVGGVGGINRTPALSRAGAAAVGYRAGVNTGAAYGAYGYPSTYYYPPQPYYNTTQPTTYPYYQAPVTPYTLPNYNPV